MFISILLIETTGKIDKTIIIYAYRQLKEILLKKKIENNEFKDDRVWFENEILKNSILSNTKPDKLSQNC